MRRSEYCEFKVSLSGSPVASCVAACCRRRQHAHEPFRLITECTPYSFNVKNPTKKNQKQHASIAPSLLDPSLGEKRQKLNPRVEVTYLKDQNVPGETDCLKSASLQGDFTRRLSIQITLRMDHTTLLDL